MFSAPGCWPREGRGGIARATTRSGRTRSAEEPQIDKIGAALLSTNLTFRDLAERVTAPRPATSQPSMDALPPEPMMAGWPASEIRVDQLAEARTPARPIPADAVLSNDELSRLGGYRTGPVASERQAGDAATPADPSQMHVEAELSAFGYRTVSAPNFGRYGTGPVPETFEAVPGESVEAAGDRLALWALAKTGQPFWQDLETGRGYLPGVTVPGKGVVQPDGRLGPLSLNE